jgi:membrane-bound lytic murein transglycosylase D
MKAKVSIALLFGFFLFQLLKADVGLGFLSFNKNFSDSTAPYFDLHSNTIQLNPQLVQFVEDYSKRYASTVEDLEGRGKPYLLKIENIFRQYNLPVELKYLAVIESKLKISARSHAGAVGPWQFMPATARNYGLKVNSYVDERKDFVKSTHAAAKYLSALYNEFGDWLLVIAAYNGGPGVVYNAIKKSGSDNFWKLQQYLPTESRNHVKKYIALHYLMEDQGGITTITKYEAESQLAAVAHYKVLKSLSPEELQDIKTRNISGKYHAAVIAKYVMMDLEDFLRYNPHFDELINSGDNQVVLKLPTKKMEMFVEKRYSILNESVNILLSANQSQPESVLAAN